MANITYHEEQYRKNTQKLRNLLAEMPPFVTTYFRGIEQTTASRTRIAYAVDLKVFFEYLQATNPLYKEIQIRNFDFSVLTQLNATDIEEYEEYLKLYTDKNGKEITNNERGIKRKLASLRSFYGYFHRNKMIDENPTVQVSMPKLHQKNIIRMNDEEVVDFLDEVESGNHLTKHQQAFHKKTKVRDLAIVTLLLGTGIRVSECVGIDITDIDFMNDRINIVRKGGYESFIYYGE